MKISKIITTLIMFFVSSLSVAEERYTLMSEFDVCMGEYCNFSTQWKLTKEKVDLYNSISMKQTSQSVNSNEKITILTSVLELQRYGEVEITNKDITVNESNLLLMNSDGRIKGVAQTWINLGIPEGISVFELADKQQNQIQTVLQHAKNLPLYRYSGEGYHYVKVGPYFVLINATHFRTIKKPIYSLKYQIKTNSGLIGWVKGSDVMQASFK